MGAVLAWFEVAINPAAHAQPATIVPATNERTFNPLLIAHSSIVLVESLNT
jgi:hypothetical protein